MPPFDTTCGGEIPEALQHELGLTKGRQADPPPLLDSGPQAEWGHARRAGPPLLTDEQPPTWQHRYLVGARTARLQDSAQVLDATEKPDRACLVGPYCDHLQPAPCRAARCVGQAPVRGDPRTRIHRQSQPSPQVSE